MGTGWGTHHSDELQAKECKCVLITSFLWRVNAVSYNIRPGRDDLFELIMFWVFFILLINQLQIDAVNAVQCTLGVSSTKRQKIPCSITLIIYTIFNYKYTRKNVLLWYIWSVLQILITYEMLHIFLCFFSAFCTPCVHVTKEGCLRLGVCVSVCVCGGQHNFSTSCV